MSIRSSSLPVRGDLSPQLQDILRRNGMQAHIIRQGDSFLLAVQGHDSPLLTYHINYNQLQSLSDWGTNHANKMAYNTFTGIVGHDFHLPKNFVHARNANGRVAMGLHGYRIGTGEYGRMPSIRGLMWGHPHHDLLGWTPRMQDGFHMRRFGGHLFMEGAPMIPDRPDGRIKPSELQNGSYGFYYKGQESPNSVPEQDVLADLQAVIKPAELPPRHREEAKPYQDLIASDVYFTEEKWRDCLQSHGILVDTEKKTLTIQSEATKHDFVYDLTDEEMKVLNSNSLREFNLQSRIDIINSIIKGDFDGQITMNMLNSNQQINIRLHPEMEAELRETRSSQQNVIVAMDGQQLPPLDISETESHDEAHVNGSSLYALNKDKGWFREGNHGREVLVEDIKVEPIILDTEDNKGKHKTETKYKMTAVINGESISHEISQRDYNKFMAIDDYHRMKLFSHIFKEVDMKNYPGTRSDIGAKIGGALLAGLTVMGELGRGPHSGPSFFMEHHAHHEPGPHVFFKPGVDSPQELAARAFNAGLNAGEHHVGISHTR